MLDRDMLFTFAEIAIALAGFSAIIGVLSSRQQSIDLKANSLRLQVMLETCFMAEFIARARTKDMPNMTLTRLNVNTVNWALSLGADLILVAIVLSLVGTHAQAFYVLALFFQLAVAGTLFVQFAAETFVAPDHE